MIDRCLREIVQRRNSAGGFSENQLSFCRPDTTSWAVLALAQYKDYAYAVESEGSALAAYQHADGSIHMPGANDSYWPTPLAVLAWSGIRQGVDRKNLALNFILNAVGTHWPHDPNGIVGHDSAIRGWPWIRATHSFIDPTAMTLLALEINGYREHPRFQEGIQMILDRQLPHGGWNYGNTIIYGKELFPLIESSGIALTALAGNVPKNRVVESIDYLMAAAETCRTPLSLGWALFGLGAWGEFPTSGCKWIEETLQKQSKYGTYETTLLSILSIAYQRRGDFRQCFK